MRLFVENGYGEDLSDQVVEVVLKQVEGQVAALTIVRKQVSLARLSSRDRNIVVLFSPTGTRANAKVLAKGYVDGMPSDLFGSYQTLSVKCSPRKVDQVLLDWAKANLAQKPYFDEVVSDCDPENKDAYLLGRYGFYHVDPATHAISIIDELSGSKTHDMRRKAIIDTDGVQTNTTPEFGAPVSTVRGRLTVDFETSADGECDISTVVPSVRTLDRGFAESPGNGIEVVESQGWSGPGTVVSGAGGWGMSESIPNVTEYEVTREVAGQKSTYSVFASAEMQSYNVKFGRLPVKFSLRQARKEIVEATLRVPVQGGYFGEDESEEIVEVSTKNVHDFAGVKAYAIGRSYAVGDQVTYNGRRYRCTKAHTATSFLQPSGDYETRGYSFGVPIRVPKPCWRRVPDSPSEFTPGSASFVRTELGRRVLQHLTLRMAKLGRRKLRALRVTQKYGWNAAWEIGLKDEVTFEIVDVETLRTDDVRYKPATGKVVSVEHRWKMARDVSDKPEPPTVTVEIGVPVGSGGGRAISSYFAGDYSAGGYSVGSIRTGGVVPGSVVVGDSDEARDFGDNQEFDRAPADIDLARLADPLVWIEGVDVRGSAAAQAAAARLIASEGGDIKECASRVPTKVSIRMRALPVTQETITSNFSVSASLTGAPKGIDWI